MEKNWIPLQSIPVTGKSLRIDDQAVWESFLQEFGVNCRILEPLSADIEILPQAEGILFRGRITGKVALPCDRCANDSIVLLDQRFDSYESFPADVLPGAHAKAGEDLFGDVDEAVIRNAAHGRGVEINPAALVWEEFSLALPIKPLCGEDCKGLCPVCGINRNSETCSCESERGDPRLEVLRGLTIRKK